MLYLSHYYYLIQRHSLLRLVMGLLICIAHALLLAMTPPYKQASTAFTAIATSVLLLFTLLVALLVMMYDTLPAALTEGFFGFDSVLPLAVFIFAFTVGVLLVCLGALGAAVASNLAKLVSFVWAKGGVLGLLGL